MGELSSFSLTKTKLNAVRNPVKYMVPPVIADSLTKLFEMNRF